MPNNTLPGNEGLTKEFYEIFLEDLKTPLISSFKSVFDKGELRVSQKPVVIKLIEKKDKNKRLIQNWRPISLLILYLPTFPFWEHSHFCQKSYWLIFFKVIMTLFWCLYLQNIYF